jgi:hypothetical protein
MHLKEVRLGSNQAKSGHRMSYVSADPASMFETCNLAGKDLLQHMSGDNLPGKFYGINCNTFGNSRKNPFMKIKAVAIDPAIPIEDRMRAVRLMDRIPHKDKVVHTVEAANKIMDDDSLPIGERYFFISNHEKLLKLSDHVVRDCHIHYFRMSKGKPEYPLILRLLSAQYMYCAFNHNSADWRDAQEFIVGLAADKNETVRIRAEAADILCRRITNEDAVIGSAVIAELGELYMKNKMTCIYTDAQNAHNESITESVMAIIRALLTAKLVRDKERERSTAQSNAFSGSALQEAGYEQNAGDVYEKILKLTENFDLARKNKIFAAFNLILIYPAKYEGVTLSDVLCLVWNKIQTQPEETKRELEQRVLQELYDMDETCGTGMCTRIVNVLSGYIQEEGMQIKMSIRDQLRSNIFGRLQANLKYLPGDHQDAILAEMSEDTSKKETAKEFVEAYPVYDELKLEFVDMGLIELTAFDEIHKKCIDDFLGIVPGLS